MERGDPPFPPEDVDVAAERVRIESRSGIAAGSGMAAGSEAGGQVDRVRLVRLRKAFETVEGSTVAVDRLTFGVPACSCFALLGPNGAGKTTTMSMLTGDIRPSSGDATLCSFSIWTGLLSIFRLTGFCPQFGGLWPHMKLRQHLALYLSLKGFSGAALEAEAQRIETAYGLTPHAAKRVSNLSGGTRRKLSAAIALSCGRPMVIFLDEPTTGVDVSTRRFLWDRISEASSTATVLLSTHYMDEADALAHRIGIMARGQLRVIGSPQHLKSRHGGGYRLEIKGSAEMADVAQVDQV
jgi:ABC-type multidrug transport system ATPase subunit